MNIHHPRQHSQVSPHRSWLIISAILIYLIGVTSCQSTTPASSADRLPKVLVMESFLADISRNVSGDRLVIDSLIPNGMDPHAFEPTPRDVVKIADSHGTDRQRSRSRKLACPHVSKFGQTRPCH